jgi:1-deoxyxylulose-5-phosphate synthase
MQHRNLGKSGLRVSGIGLGGVAWGKVPEKESISLIHQAVDAGINFIDTADIYGKPKILSIDRGISEMILGKALKDRRRSVILATKVGSRVSPDLNDAGLHRSHIIEGVEMSLKRLQTDYLDLFYAHIWDYTTPIEETLRAMDDLVRQGKVRYIGCSNYFAWQLGKALWVSEKCNLEKYACIQVLYNFLTRNVEEEILPLCESEGVGVTTWAPLAGGLLTGKYEGYDPTSPPPEVALPYHMFWNKANFEAISKLKKTAESHGYTLSQLTLAWQLNNPVISSVICGISYPSELKENLEALNVKFTKELVDTCNEAWKIINPHPPVYHPDSREAERDPAK